MQVVTMTQATEQGPYTESLTQAVTESTGSGDAGAVVVTASNGRIDPSLIGTHAEPLTDGHGNFIFANGDVIMVIGVPN